MHVAEASQVTNINKGWSKYLVQEDKTPITKKALTKRVHLP